MESTQEELKAHLLETDHEYRRLASEHSEYHRLLEAIEAKQPLTPADEEEEHRLKKIKLRLKDQMNEILARHRAAPVH
jgi:uncharacterized protein YdcH (DUF465 family)